MATFGFQDLLSNISYIRSVPDAQLFAANAAWYKELPADLRQAFDGANEKTQIETFAQIEKARTESIRILREGGCQFYNPNDAEMKQWMEENCAKSKREGGRKRGRENEREYLRSHIHTNTRQRHRLAQNGARMNEQKHTHRFT